MSYERRLLVVAESLGIGGTESHLIRISVPLAARGWNIAIYCLSERGCRADQVEKAGIKVFSPPTVRWVGSRNPANLALAASHLFRLIRRWRPQIIHFYLPGPYLIGAPTSMAARTPLKVMSRRSLSIYQNYWPMAARAERFLHRRMDAIIGNSRAVLDDLAAEGVPANKTALIYNGIDTRLPFPDRSDSRRALGVPDDAFVGLMVANLISYKGHKDLIEALASAAPRLPLNWRVFCAGRDEGLQLRLEKLVMARNLGANIKFLGERSDVPALLAAADFGILSSHQEGFSNVILESMAAGLPMIVTNVGGNPEAVLDRQTGIVVPPHDPQALGQAIVELAHDGTLRRQLADGAVSRVRKEFSMESCVNAHERLYEQLLDQAVARFSRGVQ